MEDEWNEWMLCQIAAVCELRAMLDNMACCERTPCVGLAASITMASLGCLASGRWGVLAPTELVLDVAPVATSETKTDTFCQKDSEVMLISIVD